MFTEQKMHKLLEWENRNLSTRDNDLNLMQLSAYELHHKSRKDLL